MPAIPLQSHASAGGSGGAASPPQLKPAPAVVDASSHVDTHVLPRRFLGPLPQSVTTSSTAVAKRRHVKRLRQKAMDKLLDGVGYDSGQARGEESGRVRKAGKREARAAVRTFRVRRRNLMNLIKDQDIQVESDSSDSDEDTKKKKGKATWLGDSFDIGREFESVPGHGNPDPAVAGIDDNGDNQPETLQDVADRVLEEPTTDEPQEILDEDDGAQDKGKDPQKPADKGERTYKPHSTAPSTAAGSFMTAQTKPPNSRDGSISGQTFVTARTELDSDTDTASTFTARVPKRTPGPPASASLHSSPRVVGSSQASSTRPLYGGSSDEHEDPPELMLSPESRQRKPRRSSTGETERPSPRRLKSALRGNQSDAEVHVEAAPPPPAIHTRHVQFPDNPVAGMDELPRNGDQEPADPREVLARSGSDIDGTSADAVQTNVDDDDNDCMPGGLVMRDRVLVKVGRHKDEQLRHFDEMTERRDPCYRFDPQEEYMVGLTMTTVDFYSDWSWRIEEWWKGSKQLRYSVPLTAVTTTMSIFNQTDMTLVLVCPWPTIVRQTARSKDREQRKSTSTWDRARHSAIADRLGMERQGSAIFILNFSERSRALDWLWYICGQLGIHLPKQVDIILPSVEETLRTTLPTNASSDNFNVTTALNSIWKSILANPEQVRLMRELRIVPQLQLAWKSSDATLDWVAYETTVTGKPRPWALLASFAQSGTERDNRVLQVRDASHHGVKIRLEDGTTLKEPAGVEGYLTRHKSGTAPKEVVYVSINDGHVFLSNMGNALPPLRPGKTGSSPAAIFPDLHKRFLKSEHRRMSSFVEKCAGTIALGDIESVKLVKVSDPEPEVVPDPVHAPADSALADAEADATPSPSAQATSSSVASQSASPPVTSHAVSTPTSGVRHTASTHATPSPTIQHRSSSGDTQPPSSTKSKRARGMSEVSSASRRSTLEPLKKQGTKKEREFEVTMRAGNTVKFEARTPEIAAEWVERLTGLVKYWTLRPRVDARGAMDAVAVHSGAAAFLGKVLDLEVERSLNNIWNWCIIDGCRAITHSSPIYIREGPWAKFHSMYLVLTGGSLVLFRVKGKVGLQSRKRVYPLFGSYVYSGILSLDELNDNSNEAFFDPKARIYSDGLQTTDGIEATTFSIRLTWPTGRFTPAQPWDTVQDSDDEGKTTTPKPFSPPRLDQKPVILVCRARSKLERDRWVWAINCEMERYARSHARQVLALRDHGKLPRHATVTRT